MLSNKQRYVNDGQTNRWTDVLPTILRLIQGQRFWLWATCHSVAHFPMNRILVYFIIELFDAEAVHFNSWKYQNVWKKFKNSGCIQ